MSHDLLAELDGYKAELDLYERRGQDERATAVRDEIKRVEDAVRQRAEELEATADKHDETGQDVRAAEARVEARRYRDALGSEGGPAKRSTAKRGAAQGRKETAEDKTPKDKA